MTAERICRWLGVDTIAEDDLSPAICRRLLELKAGYKDHEEILSRLVGRIEKLEGNTRLEDRLNGIDAGEQKTEKPTTPTCEITVSEIPIEGFAYFGASLRNVFRNEGILTVGDLLKITESEFLLFRNVGLARLKEVRYALKRYGLKLEWE